MTRREQLAWAAGFIDGEGTFGVQKDRNLLYLAVGQVNPKVLYRLRTALGVGTVYGPYKPRKENHSPYYYYRVTGTSKILEIQKLINPFLSGKKKEQLGRAIRLVTEPVLKTVEP